MRCIVTQMPVGGFGSLTSTFGNHLATMDSAPRGGDVVIRYPDGSLRFPTQEARTPFRRALHWAPVLPVAGPIDLTMRFGTADECAVAHWGGSNAARPRCQGSAQRLSCS